MSISLNNHESRIKALENGGAGSWSKGGGYAGYWAKESNTGLLIQWGFVRVSQDANVRINLPKPYSNTDYFADGNEIRNGKDGNSIALPGSKDVKGFTLYCLTLTNVNTWFTIGYLISNRILKYAYACKNLLFTPLRKIGGVK